jgi:hypothetical protein
VQLAQVALAVVLHGWVKYFPSGQAHWRQITSVVALQAPNEVSPEEHRHRLQTVSVVTLQATTAVIPSGQIEQGLHTASAVALQG